ncbi:MAG: aminotransferase class III-fold pyridoxal phosphate-dependent enzyme [Rhodobacteraceae bacterium]|nr:aminotransferase class III-fold pyridoxal phosphate-dependent enzyme [Paracoccaceae bacterium]
MTRSNDLFQQARQTMPGGISHRYRWRLPNPLYVTRAQGAHKWDADGNRYIDYKMGAASQMMGHCHPEITAALQAQAGEAIFAADCNPIEVDWSRKICDMVPSVDQVRFTASGTESTMLAIRIARAFTGRDRILRVDGHYHGWHDHVMKGAKAGSDVPPSLGVPDAIAALTDICPPDAALLNSMLGSGKYAAVLVEASGANYGAVPMAQEILTAAQSAAHANGSLLILDEIITGFRWSPGGRQALAGVTPDLTTMAKIVTGGMPGGAVGGTAKVMAMLDPSVTTRGHTPGVLHQGTFNGAPIVAVAGSVMMDLLADGSAQAHADRIAADIRAGVNALFAKHGIEGLCYGESSTFHLWFGPHNGSMNDISASAIRSPVPKLVTALQDALNRNGVDLMSAMSAVTSAVHNDDDVADTLAAFDRALPEIPAALEAR